MSTETYRPLTDIADEWSRDPNAPGTRARLFRMLVSAMCDGEFYEHGLAVRAHALLLASDPDGEAYNPYANGAERLPDLEVAPDPTVLHDYFAPCIVGSLPDSIACYPDAFFDWIKNGGLDQLNRNGRLAFNYIAISREAFLTWCRTAGIRPPAMISNWQSRAPQPSDHSIQNEGERKQPQPASSVPLRTPGRIRVLNTQEDAPPTIPDKSLLSLCEAVTFLATGKARQSNVIRRFMHRQGNLREPKGLWNRLERDADALLAVLRNGDLIGHGSLDNGPIEPISRSYFANDVYADFIGDRFAEDLTASEEAFGRQGVPTYRDVRFWTKEFAEVSQKRFAELRRQHKASAKQTIGAQTRCQAWLMEKMRAGPQELTKTEYGRQAADEFGIGQNQFIRAWELAKSAVGNPDWGRPGRRPKRKGPA